MCGGKQEGGLFSQLLARRVEIYVTPFFFTVIL